MATSIAVRAPNVYIPQQLSRLDEEKKVWVPAVNLKPATAFGTLQFLLPPGIQPVHMAPIVRALKEKFEDATEDDYFLPMGAPVLIAASAAILLRKTGRIKFLQWDRFEHNYIQYDLEI